MMKPNKQRGFTITEIMVAVAIGLIGTLVVFKALQSTNIVARNTTGGSDAATTASIALFGIEHDVRMAGYGINDTNIVGCQILMANSAMTLPADVVARTAAFAPALVLGTAANPTLRIAYAGGRSIVPTKLTKIQSGTSAETMRVVNLYGLKDAGTVILMTEANTASTLTPLAGKPCTIAQTSKNFTSETDRDLMTVNSGLSPFSAPGGTGQTYLLEGRVHNLGSLSFANSTLPANILVWREYRVDPATETLQEKNIFTSSNYTTVASNVTAMYVDYILRNGSVRSGFPVLNPLTNPTTDLPVLRDVVGMRVSLLTRSAQPDYSKGVACQTSTDLTSEQMVTPQDSAALSTGFKDATGNDVRFTLSRANNANAFCYRYKAQSTTIMMRNMAWLS